MNSFFHLPFSSALRPALPANRFPPCDSHGHVRESSTANHLPQFAPSPCPRLAGPTPHSSPANHAAYMRSPSASCDTPPLPSRSSRRCRSALFACDLHLLCATPPLPPRAGTSSPNRRLVRTRVFLPVTHLGTSPQRWRQRTQGEEKSRATRLVAATMEAEPNHGRGRRC